MKLMPISGYHAYDDDGNLIGTVHIDSSGGFIIDNGEDSLLFALDIEDAEAIYILLGKIIKEYMNVPDTSNILTILERNTHDPKDQKKE